MKKNFLSLMPSPVELNTSIRKMNFSEFREVNAHIHPPYSFSTFDNMESAFMMAKKEGISVLVFSPSVSKGPKRGGLFGFSWNT